jgi:hypothetical protein
MQARDSMLACRWMRSPGWAAMDFIGCCGLRVHAESEQARSFYEDLIPDF